MCGVLDGAVFSVVSTVGNVTSILNQDRCCMCLSTFILLSVPQMVTVMDGKLLNTRRSDGRGVTMNCSDSQRKVLTFRILTKQTQFDSNFPLFLKEEL